MIKHARNGNVLWAKGVLFGTFAVVGAPAAAPPLRSGLGASYALRADDGGDGSGDALTEQRKPADFDRKRFYRPGAVWTVAVEGLLVSAFTGLAGPAC